MNKKMMWVGALMLSAVLGFGLYGVGNSLASGGYRYDDDDDERGEHGWRGRPVPSAMLREESRLYREECGSCHLAYPAQLLPPAGWQKLMSGLDDHFGENAELDEAARKQITNYLLQLSTPRRGKYRKMLRNLDPQREVLRITELPYFKHEHREIPDRMIRGNDKVRSLSQCDACHLDAEKGYFDEDRVRIPGYGRWDD